MSSGSEALEPAREKRRSTRPWVLTCAGVVLASALVCCVCAGTVTWASQRVAQADRDEKVRVLRTDLERRTATRDDASTWQRLLRKLVELAQTGMLQARALTTLWNEYQSAVRDGRLDEEELARLLAMLSELAASGGTSTGYDDTPSEGSHHDHWDWD